MSKFEFAEDNNPPEKLDSVIAYLKQHGLGVIETNQNQVEGIAVGANGDTNLSTSSGTVTVDIHPTDNIIEPELVIANHDLPNGRWYCESGETNENLWVPSVTTILSVLHKGHGFNVWNRNYGHLAPLYRDLAAIRGSIVHYFFEQLVVGCDVTVDSVWNFIQQEQDESWKTLTTHKNLTYEVLRFIESFVAFWQEKDPIPVAVEYPVLMPSYGGRLDLIVEMKKTKASKKRSRCLLDLKTGANYYSHGLQNSAYKHAWEKVHPELPIDYMGGIYVTSQYRNEPTFKIGWQKDEFEIFQAAEKIWYSMNKSTKTGKVSPKLIKKPRTSFNLYNKQEGAK